MSFSSLTGSSSGSSPATGAAWNIGALRRDRKLWCSIRERVEQDIGAQQLTTVELEDMLRQLLGISLPNSRIRSEELAALLAALAQVLPLSSDLLCSEFTRFVLKCCMKEKMQFTSDQLHVILAFYLQFIKCGASWYTASAIRAVGLILHDNAERATDDLDALVAVLLKYLDPSGVDIEARYAATSCVSNICTQAARLPDVFQFFGVLLRMVVENFRQQALGLTQGRDERILVKACTCSMKCIFTIISLNHEQLADRIEANLSSLLSSMRQVVGHGLVLRGEQDDLVFAFQDEFPPNDSDSSLCGSDTNASTRQGSEGLLARLRITVLVALEAIAQHFPKSLTSSIGLYLPEQATPYMTLYGNAPSILTLLIADPCEKVRMTAARALEALWEKMPLKHYFRHVSSVVAPSTSFASMPKKMSHMLYQVHVTLVYCIQNEKNGAPLSQILKTTAVVIQHCPYANVIAVLDKGDLRPSLGDVLKALASSLYSTTSSSDHSVRMASLSCFSALLTIQEPLPAVLEWMIQTNNPRTAIDVAHISIVCGSANLGRRSFVEELLAIAARPEEASRSLLRLEAMSLLSKVAKNYSSALSIYWKRLSSFLLASFQDVDPNVRLQAVKILENYIKGDSTVPRNATQPAVAPSTVNITEDGTVLSVSPRPPNRWLHTMQDASAVSRTECLDFLATHLVRAFSDTSHHVRTSVCACFTLLRAKDWEQLLDKAGSRPAGASRSADPLRTYSRIFLQTPRDSSPVVRAAGFRLIGSLCLVPVFKTPDFASSVVSLALDALTDSTINVRVRAAWALGNVCTTIGPEMVKNSSKGKEDVVLYDLLSPGQMREIVEKMLVYVNDNDKVASSVARTLGLVCRWIYLDAFVQRATASDLRALEDLMAKALVLLAAKVNSGSPKVRWNACHAIAKILLCPGLPLASATWAPAVFQALITAISQQENFKVRISASGALRVSATRSAYGTFFQSALQATIDALETASDLKDVTEFKYKEQLETQLSFTLVHLIHIATEEDDELIRTSLEAKPRGFLYDWLLHNLHRMQNAIDQHQDNTSGVIGDEGQGDAGGDGGSSGGGGGTEVHDVNPIKKEEILSAVRTLLRIVEHARPATRQRSPSLSILYDAKLSLERDVLYSNEDIVFDLF
ncbi:TPA: hypothetical protein N0F65_007776 [Lagenidium giganteum]|uniref:DUF4042 domain-containing protein n=1 Tax=Lagenidium giganteum TaxID=4803 RepID=A0AAV2YP83_9STRA|nr:TPA: hypothetical protein N0F65_007776 [Lagenidium giganteum]